MADVFRASRPVNTKDTPLPYTASPWKLLFSDIVLAVKFSRYIPWLFYPVDHLSGPIDELSSTVDNLFVIAVHVILFFYQVSFLISLPILGFFFMPVPLFVFYVFMALAINELVCSFTLNTGPRILHSTLPLAAQRNHIHERWIFINGVTVG